MCTTGNELLTFHAAQKLVFRRISRLRANQSRRTYFASFHASKDALQPC
jgi:hypothetical protein